MNPVEAKVSVLRVFNTFHNSPSTAPLSDDDVCAIVDVIIGDSDVSAVSVDIAKKVEFYNTIINNFPQIVQTLSPTTKEHLIGVLHDRFIHGLKMSECAKKYGIENSNITRIEKALSTKHHETLNRARFYDQVFGLNHPLLP